MSTVDHKLISQDAIFELEKLAASLDIGLGMTADMPAEDVNDALLLMGQNPKAPLPPRIKELLSQTPHLPAETEEPGEPAEARALNILDEEFVGKEPAGTPEGREPFASPGPLPKEQGRRDVLAEKDLRFRETWQPRLTLIVSLLALTITGFAVFIKDYAGISSLVTDISTDQIHRFIVISNLIVSLIALIFLVKQKTKDYVIQGEKKFRSLAELDEGADIQIYITNLNNRVGKLVNQFRLHMALFAFSLVLIYGVIWLELLTRGEASGPQEIFRNIGYFPVLTNLINLLGALFVYLGFSVLFNKTLEPHQTSLKTGYDHPDADSDQRGLEIRQILSYNSSLYWGIPLMFFVLYTLIFVSLSVSYAGFLNKEDATRFLNIFDLIAGSANGLAMSLLFGRYVSIEQSISNTGQFKTVFENVFYPFSALPYKSLVSLGIIFVLPIYALAQPLFGSLRITAFGNPNKFETIVFAICLVGKICFFHLTYLLVSKRLLHLYLYGMVAEVGNYKELGACFDDSVALPIVSGGDAAGEAIPGSFGRHGMLPTTEPAQPAARLAG